MSGLYSRSYSVTIVSCGQKAPRKGAFPTETSIGGRVARLVFHPKDPRSDISRRSSVSHVGCDLRSEAAELLELEQLEQLQWGGPRSALFAMRCSRRIPSRRQPPPRTRSARFPPPCHSQDRVCYKTGHDPNFGAQLRLPSPACDAVELALQHGFVCPLVVTDPTDSGATIALAQA